MSDIRLQIKIKSSRIMRAMEKAGIYSVAELCRIMGMPRHQSDVGEMVNMKRSPVQRDGSWRPIALELATAVHCEPEDLWPEYLRYVELKKNEVNVDMDVEQFQELASNPDHLLRDMGVKIALSALPARERHVLELRFGLNGNGEHTLEEAGAAIERHDGKKTPVNRERVRQLEQKALRRLKSWHDRQALGLTPEDIQ